MNKGSFNWNKHQEVIENEVEMAIAKSKYIVTQAEVKYFMALLKLVSIASGYINHKHKTCFSWKVSFGLTYENFINELKSKFYYDEKDKRLMRLLAFNDSLVSGSVIDKRYHELQVEKRGEKMKKEKPSRSRRFFPTNLPRVTKQPMLEKVRREKAALKRKIRELIKKEYEMLRRIRSPVYSQSNSSAPNDSEIHSVYDFVSFSNSQNSPILSHFDDGNLGSLQNPRIYSPEEFITLYHYEESMYPSPLEPKLYDFEINPINDYKNTP